MSAPVLNRKLVLEAASQVPDGAGGATEAWGVLGTMWAELRPGSGRERSTDAGLLALSSYRITVRAAPAGATNRPKPGQRFREGARLFRIIAVSEADRAGRYLTCFANEEVSA
ncbi:head-tail adaptor protein [Pseudoprimorskyibacter insulae]|uniref:Phage head-tail joining protein n=1 Tax=Pseudoprimorskyibacter insulae TaxID=1695997 RepID=A0A2R8AXS3_9RHOB|nr:head-tail adaptor protein [Pseudoprimorskyibacter insulae]SPF80833.1 hypothetical protein PRI8871_02645 [Pseudoprimorskyibacter insulae]